MKPFTQLTGVTAPLLDDDMNTDQIIPSAYLKDVNADLAEGLFAYLRRQPNGEKINSFVLEMDEFCQAKILLVGENFGCGSSREHAVWALQEFGIQCLIGKSFAELFRDNCLKNGVLTITLDEPEFKDVFKFITGSQSPQLTVDLEKCEISGQNKLLCRFNIQENERHMLLNGLDDIGLTLGDERLISSWENAIIKEFPYFQASISVDV
jgi:3-isopropylmalate/(R)-2-methylmalate dehydratase small subunit